MTAAVALIATLILVPAITLVSQTPAWAGSPGGIHLKHVHKLPPGKEAHGAGPREDVPPGLRQGPGPRPPVVGRAPTRHGPGTAIAASAGSAGSLSSGGPAAGSAANPNDGALEQLAGFPGTAYTTNIPPDTQMAVGPTEVIEMVNSSSQMFTRAGVGSTAVLSSTLFGAPDNAMNKPFYSDPRVVYDALSGRFFASILIFDSCTPVSPTNPNGCTTNNNSEVDLAVSNNDHPSSFTMADWTVYDVANDQSNILYDQPKLGVSSDKVVMTWNERGFIGPYQFAVFQKSDLLAAVAHPGFHFFPLDTTHFNVIPVVTLTATDTEYAVNADQNSSTLTVTAFTGTPADNNVAMTMTDFSIGSYSSPPGAVQPNSGPTLDAGVPAVQSAVWENNEIWAGGNDSCTPPGDNTARACLRLDTVSTSGSTPALLQDVDLGQVGAYLFYPAVMVDTFGNFFVGHSVSSSTEFGTAGMSFAPAGPFPSTFAGIDYANGVGVYNNFLNGVNRWGDYSGAGQDPNNPKDVWFAEELGSTSTTSQAPWGTQIGRFTQAPPTVTGISPASGPELNDACAPAVTVSGTDFVAGQTSVSFGTTSASSANVTSPESLTVVAPSHARGTVDVTATTPAGTSPANGSDLFTYIADTTPPTASATATPSPNGAGWNNTSPVTVNITASDGTCGSGVQKITYSATGAQPIGSTDVFAATASIPITADGVTTVTFTATDNAGNTSAPQTIVVRLDTVPPTISITSPAAGSYLLNQAVAAAYSCADATSGVATCAGPVPSGSPVDTKTLGSHTFTVTASDVAGNQSNSSVTYGVTYKICLLYDPAHPPRGGNSTIAIKVQLCDANNVNLSSANITLTASQIVGPTTEPFVATFRFDSTLAGYIVNVSTKGLTAGSYNLLFTVSGADTTTHMAPFTVR